MYLYCSRDAYRNENRNHLSWSTFKLNIHKNIIVDENQKPVAVQILINEFNKMKDIIENYGLAKLMDDTDDTEQLAYNEAITYYESIK